MKIKIVSKKNYRQLREIYASFDVSSKGSICLAVGGDGTFVRAAKQYEGPILPIRSEESGSIGYYSDVSLNDIDFVIKSLKSGSYYIEKLENKMEVSFNGACCAKPDAEPVNSGPCCL